MAKHTAGKLRVVRELRPLVYTFTDGDALLQLLAACRSRGWALPADELWWRGDRYSAVLTDRTPSAAGWALLEETAVLSGWGNAAAEAVRCGLCLTDGGTVLPERPDPPL